MDSVLHSGITLNFQVLIWSFSWKECWWMPTHTTPQWTLFTGTAASNSFTLNRFCPKQTQDPPKTSFLQRNDLVFISSILTIILLALISFSIHILPFVLLQRNCSIERQNLITLFEKCIDEISIYVHSRLLSEQRLLYEITPSKRLYTYTQNLCLWSMVSVHCVCVYWWKVGYIQTLPLWLISESILGASLSLDLVTFHRQHVNRIWEPTNYSGRTKPYGLCTLKPLLLVTFNFHPVAFNNARLMTMAT